MEAVCILHDELAAAEQTEARTDLVTEFHLNLIQRAWQFLIRTQLVADKRGDELLVRRTKAEAMVMTIGQAHELRPVIVPTAALMPQLGGLKRRHHDLLRACSVHFLAHDSLDFRKHLLPEREERVHTRSGLADHCRTQKQSMTCYFGISRVFLQRRHVEFAHV